MYKASLLVFCLAVSAASAFGQTFYGTTDVSEFRSGRDKEFRTPTESPLLGVDFDKFTGLKYFPVDERYRVKATFTRTSDEKYFLMPTSAGNSRKFVKYGILRFSLDGKEHQLNAYQTDRTAGDSSSEYADLLFVPFRDLTNGKETYGVGRYIDIRLPSADEMILDLNLAYSPNCAYGSVRYACPIPPKENRLAAEIRAGEMKFDYTQAAAAGESAN